MICNFISPLATTRAAGSQSFLPFIFFLELEGHTRFLKQDYRLPLM